jgi:hypothetical protein
MEDTRRSEGDNESLDGNWEERRDGKYRDIC